MRQPSDRFSYTKPRDGRHSDRFAPREAREWPRGPRADHLGKQDWEDIRESARAKELARSPRQRNYLDGGRRLSSRDDRSFPSEKSFRNRERSEQTATEISRATTQYARTRLDSHVRPTSDLPNRAARRAAIYGPGDTPPRWTRNSGRDPDKHSGMISSHGEFRTPTPRSTVRERAEEDPDKYSRRNSADGDHRTSRPWSARRERDDLSERPAAAANMHRGQDDSEEVASEQYSYRTQKSRADEWSEVQSDVPLAIPYTTPASEFLYGTSVVSAALKYSRRKFYKFYCYGAPDRVNTSQDTAVRNLASSQGVEVVPVQGEWLRIMDKMSTGRPHNVSGFLKLTCSRRNH